MKYVALGLLLVSSFAAAGIRPLRYQEPTSGPTAIVNFHDEYQASSILRVAFLNPYRCTTNRIVTFYGDPSNTSIKVDARHPFTFRSSYVTLLGGVKSGTICAITLTLPVIPDSEYRVVSNAQEKTCSLNIDIKQNDGTWIAAPDITERKSKAPWVESQGFCVADESFKQFDGLKK